MDASTFSLYIADKSAVSSLLSSGIFMIYVCMYVCMLKLSNLRALTNAYLVCDRYWDRLRACEFLGWNQAWVRVRVSSSRGNIAGDPRLVRFDQIQYRDVLSRLEEQRLW